MARRTKRSDMPNDTAATIRALGGCRQAMIDVLRVVKPMGPAYHAASMVISAIDGFATFLTGQRYHFSVGSSAPADPRRTNPAPGHAKEVEPPPSG